MCSLIRLVAARQSQTVFLHAVGQIEPNKNMCVEGDMLGKSCMVGRDCLYYYRLHIYTELYHNYITLRNHAYSNILKIHHQKIFRLKNSNIFSYFCSARRF